MKVTCYFCYFCYQPTSSKLHGEATPATSRRSKRDVGTQVAVRCHVEGNEREGYEGGMHVIRDKDARDSGQLLFFREKCCIFALSFIKNGKWEINH